MNSTELCKPIAFTTAVGTVHLNRSRSITTIVLCTTDIQNNSPIFAIANHYVFILLRKHIIHLSFNWLLMMQWCDIQLLFVPHTAITQDEFIKTKKEGYDGCLTVHLPHEIMWKASLMKQSNFIDIFLARHDFVHTPIIRGIGCWVAAYGFLHRIFGWVVILRAAA